MPETMQEVNDSAQELEAQLDLLEQEAGDFRERVDEVGGILQADRDAIQDARQGFLDKLAFLVQAVQGLQTGLETVSSDYKQGIGKATEAIGEAIAQFDTERTNAVASFSSAEQLADGGKQHVTSQAGAHETVAHQRYDKLSELRDEAQAVADNVLEFLDRTGDGYAETARHTEEFVNEVHAQARQLQENVAAHHEQALGSARQFVDACLRDLERVASQQVCQPLDAHCEHLRQELRDRVRAALHDLLQRVDHAITEIEDSLLGSCENTSGKRQELAPVRESLEGVMEPLNAALDTVKSTAGIVGFSP